MTKKTFPLLTAQAARDYVPAQDPSGVYAKIDYAVRNAVALGRDHVDISTIIPQPNSGAWMTGKIDGNASIAGFIETLEGAGYVITTAGGTNAARGFIRISWAEQPAEA